MQWLDVKHLSLKPYQLQRQFKYSLSMEYWEGEVMWFKSKIGNTRIIWSWISSFFKLIFKRNLAHSLNEGDRKESLGNSLLPECLIPTFFVLTACFWVSCSIKDIFANQRLKDEHLSYCLKATNGCFRSF